MGAAPASGHVELVREDSQGIMMAAGDVPFAGRACLPLHVLLAAVLQNPELGNQGKCIWTGLRLNDVFNLYFKCFVDELAKYQMQCWVYFEVILDGDAMY